MGKILRPFSDRDGNKIGYSFWCLGCEEYHGVWVYQNNTHTGAVWSFNENMEKPTFAPSILVKRPYLSEAGKIRESEFKKIHGRLPENDELPYDSLDVCHSLIRDGNIQYLGDCTHKLAGITIALTSDPNN